MKKEEKALADECRDVFNVLSPFIEKHTAVVCPYCEDICCIDRHGRYDGDDLVFLGALGVDGSQQACARRASDRCRYLTETGCSLERWRRPYRCTYFFCDTLLKNMEDDNAKLYRAFVEYFHALISARQRLLNLASPPDQ